ncbi:MAG: hypothetical protein AB7V56_06630 [Candidatus Nitrosocosmicus sp.]
MIVRKLTAAQTKTNHNADKIPSIEDQIEQSLTDLASGNYEEYPIDEYIEVLKTRFDDEEEVDSKTT